MFAVRESRGRQVIWQNVPPEFIWLRAMGFGGICLWELVKEFFLNDEDD